MKKRGKAKKGVCIILFCILLVVYILWGRAWPRRWFISSDQFLDSVYPARNGFHVNGPEIFNFPEKIPASAENTRYHYYYKGFLDKKYGISFTLDKEDYQGMKEEYLSFFKEEEARYSGDKYFWFEFNEKMSTEFLENEELDDLKHLFHDKTDSYTVLAYEVFGGSAHTSYYIGGVICNDERNEMIIFYFFDAGRNEKRDTETEI